jgi:endonuclease/exonuclease/phosphatase family metal-dependent hydrolase
MPRGSLQSLTLAAKASATALRVVTWNIRCGQDEGPPWRSLDWPVRKHSLRAALDQARPDVLCVQEARPGQVAFLEQTLPGHERVGVGRDDGRHKGEHCAILFDRTRFERLGGGTFWLRQPIDRPQPRSLFTFPRICTWVRLRDRITGRELRFYNSHLPLREKGRREAARVLLGQMAAGAPSDVVVLTADFNASPSAASRKQFTAAGLIESAVLAGQPAGVRTFHVRGLPLLSLDAILVGPGATVDRHLRLDARPGRCFPSDHFGLLADLSFAVNDDPTAH